MREVETATRRLLVSHGILYHNIMSIHHEQTLHGQTSSRHSCTSGKGWVVIGSKQSCIAGMQGISSSNSVIFKPDLLSQTKALSPIGSWEA